jgi:2-C-methyl-D-erythritol 4-phosphate cytidylyltransferase
MNMALILAGGTGVRMNVNAKPKQFLELHGKPIILYTLEHFEKHPAIDGIGVVCLANWIPQLKSLLRLYGLKKVVKIAPGGDSGHESIRLGLEAMASLCGRDDIVLIHDGVRPLITEALISDNIAGVKKYGSVITVEPARESVLYCGEGDLVDAVPARGSVFTVKAPQSFRYGMILDLYRRAHHEEMPTFDSAHLLGVYKVPMHTVRSSPNNVKITTPADFYVFRSLYQVCADEQIFGM